MSFKTVNVPYSTNKKYEVDHMGIIETNNESKRKNDMIHNYNKKYDKMKDNMESNLLLNSNSVINLGQYLDLPNPDFVNAIALIDKQKNLMSEKLYYLYRDLEFNEDLFKEVHDKFRNDNYHLEKSIKYSIIKLNDDTEAEALLIKEDTKRLETESRKMLNEINTNKDQINSLNLRLKNLEKRLGISLKTNYDENDI